MFPGAWSVSVRWVRSRFLSSTHTAIGSQCNFISSGVAWLYFTAPSIKRAAQFSTFWSRCICLRGSRYSSALPTPSLLVTHAYMTCSVAAAVRHRLVLEMLRRRNTADLHTTITCDSIVISASSWTPRHHYGHRESPWPNSHQHATLATWYSLAVFESFNFKEFVFIHILIYVTHRSTHTTAASMSSWRDFTEM